MIVRHNILFIFLTQFWLLAIGCIESKSKINIQKNDRIVIFDSSVGCNFRLKVYDCKNRDGFYPIYYIGELKDTIILSKNPICPYNNINDNYVDRLNKMRADSLKINIIIDTNINFIYSDKYATNFGNKNYEIVDSTLSYKSYAVIIYNTSQVLCPVGDFNILSRTLRQAKNKKGEWVDIESRFHFFCRSGDVGYILEPNHVLIAKLIRYKGDYKTSCRLKFRTCNRVFYSNEFYDYINERQLIDSI